MLSSSRDSHDGVKEGALSHASAVVGKVVGAVGSAVGSLVGTAADAERPDGLNSASNNSSISNRSAGAMALVSGEEEGPQYLGPLPARREFRQADVLAPELVAAVRDFDVDDVDVHLFAM